MADDTLVAALARAQAKFTTVAKSHTAEVPTKTGGKYSYTYANLADTLEAVLPILAAEGIALLQPILMTEFGPVLSTQVRKGSDMIESVFPLRVEGLQPQAVGSLITYSRRYCLTSLLAIATDDDDGQAAQDAPVRYASEPSYKPRERSYPSERPVGSGQAPGTPGRPSSDAQRNAIEKLGNKLIKKYGWSPVELSWVMSSSVGKEAPDVMTVSEASKLMDDLIAIDKGEQHATFTDDGALIGNPASLAADGTEPF